MAYEAYTAAVNEVASKVYEDWLNSRDYDATLLRLCCDWNIETHHVRSRLTQLIKAGHLDQCLSRAD